MHAEAPNQIIHFDFCFIGVATTGYCYVLVLKDDLSSWTRFVPTKAATAAAAAEASAPSEATRFYLVRYGTQD
jgi:hypothetical protein